MIIATGTSSNTIKTGNGTNIVTLSCVGTNKVTCGKDYNYIRATDGYNTILGNKGANSITLYGGMNNIKTGKNRDYVYIEAVTPAVEEVYPSVATYCNNVINTGAGIDEININAMSYNIINAGNGGKNAYNETVGNKINIRDGINTVTSGKHADRINILGGQNVINSGAGNDIITVAGGKSVINGGKGNDIYNVDITNFESDLIVTDTKGSNVLNLGKNNTKQVNIFFDVEVGKKGKAVYNYMKFTTKTLEDITEEGFDDFSGVEVSGKKVISKLEYGNSELEESTYKTFDIKSSEIDKLASDIASWLNTKDDYNSTDDVFSGGKDEDISNLVGAYTDFAKNGYVFDNNSSLLLK